MIDNRILKDFNKILKSQNDYNFYEKEISQISWYFVNFSCFVISSLSISTFIIRKTKSAKRFKKNLIGDN